MKILFVIISFIFVLGCSPDKKEEGQVLTTPSISLVIDESRIKDADRHVSGQIKLDGFQEVQTDGWIRVAYYLYHYDAHKRTDMKGFLRSASAHNFDSPFTFNFTLGESFELDLDEYSSLVVIVTVNTTDEAVDTIQLCDMKEIKWKSQPAH